ncbi:MAG: RDD family protein [Rhodanobacteraceae bacterium]|nr:RDD family protein [Rhodanobacteraceae bacterium]
MNDATPRPAHLGLRVAAAIYDFFPLLALWMATGAVALLATRGKLDPHAWWYFPTLVLVTASYYLLSWRYGGQTIGMRAWRLRVVDRNGTSPGWTAALLRFVVAQVSLAALCLGFVWCLFERERRSWHDLASGTRVLQLPKR